jgi:hypothetical protein
MLRDRQIVLLSIARAAGAITLPASMHGRGWDEDCSSPPAQIPASAANAPSSSLGFWRRNGGRAAGVMSLLAERSDRRG